METFTHFPLRVFAVAFIALWLASLAGSWLRVHTARAGKARDDDLGVILGASLTLLALIIGFSFSMATNRYDQRKVFEEAEANAIGTEYLRADVLPVPDAANVRVLLRRYTQQRIAFYETQDDARRAKIDKATGQTQNDLWSAVRAPALAQPSPVMALAVAGMNDVINSQGYTQAAVWNRIPVAAWCLMGAIALCCAVLFGFSSKSGLAGRQLAFVLPFIVAIAFFMIADIDAPRHGLIRVSPQNLESLAASLGR
jgi:hypothetical protein